MTPPAVMGLPATHTHPVTDVRRGFALGLGLMGAALPALILVQYTLAPHVDAHYWGLNPEGLRQFQAQFGLRNLPSLSADSYSLAFRLLLVLVWSGYALIVASGWQGAVLPTRPLMAGIAGTALVMAVCSPPLLSHDVYAYAAQGRLFVLYGENPYLCKPAFLTAIGDPVAHFINWNTPTVYGPVWTRIEVAIVVLLREAGLWPQVVALKLVEAGALVAAALAGRRITGHLCPGRENLTLIAIGLNPLLLLEGPGSGHNDLLLVSMLLVGTMFYLDKKYLLAALFLGLSVGIKLITLAVLPWVLMEYGRGRTGRQKMAAIAVAVALVVVPLVICFGSLWEGAATLRAMQERSLFHASPAALAQNQHVFALLRAQGLGTAWASIGLSLFQARILLTLFALLTLWLVFERQPGAWLTAWGLFAACLMFLAMGLSFPWYICWFWPVFLLRWDRLSLTLGGLCFGLSLAWTAGYGIVCEVSSKAL